MTGRPGRPSPEAPLLALLELKQREGYLTPSAAVALDFRYGPGSIDSLENAMTLQKFVFVTGALDYLIGLGTWAGAIALVYIFGIMRTTGSSFVDMLACRT